MATVWGVLVLAVLNFTRSTNDSGRACDPIGSEGGISCDCGGRGSLRETPSCCVVNDILWEDESDRARL